MSTLQLAIDPAEAGERDMDGCMTPLVAVYLLLFLVVGVGFIFVHLIAAS